MSVAKLYASIIFSIILLFPGFLMTSRIISSSGLGMLISLLLAVVFFCIFFQFFKRIKISKISVVFFTFLIMFLFLHAIVVDLMLVERLNWDKLNTSLLSLILMVFVSFVLSECLAKVEECSFHKFVVRFFWFLTILGFLFSFAYSNGLLYRKMLFFFYEPSHYALVFSPFIIYIFSSEKNLIYTAFIFIILLFLGVLLKNLVFFIILLIVLFMRFRTAFFRFAIFPIIIFCSLFYIINTDSEFANYFSERLVFNSDSENLSLLVYLSGFERIYLSLIESYGLGFGFQQMGLVGPTGVFQESLDMLNANGLNIEDGSFLASKIIFEFGIFGIVTIFIFIFKLIGIINEFDFVDTNRIKFVYSTYISFFVYLFIRGGGYFMPMVPMFLVSIFFIFRKK